MIVGIVGTGVMGRQIARLIQAYGLPVIMCGRSAESILAAQRANRAELAKAVAGGKLTERDAVAAAAALVWTRHLDDLGGCDLVLECIVEELEAKTALIAALDDRLPEAALIATNTSSLRVAAVARRAQKFPARIVGIHFVNPVHTINLVEVVAGLATSRDAVSRAMRFCEALYKEPIEVPDREGFVINSVLFAGVEAAVELVGEGVDPAVVDRLAMFGRPGMGPLAMADYVGLDVVVRILDNLDSHGAPVHLRDMVEAGKLGRKSGEGFFVYKDRS